MINKSLRRDELINKKCRLIRDIRSRGGHGVPKDTICTIIDVVRGSGFAIKTDKCPHCGQYAYITHVPREDLELI